MHTKHSVLQDKLGKESRVLSETQCHKMAYKTTV